MRVAIHKNDDIFKHSTSWSSPWIDYCEKNGISYDVVNCYENNILETLKGYDCLLWHIIHYSLQDMTFARTILNCAKNMGLSVFPDWNTSWHFDDKVAETYLLKSIDAPIPESWIFYTLNDCKKWLEGDVHYPIVAKLRCGSGSSNVKMLNGRDEVIKYAKRMFGNGYKTAPSIIYKAKSNIKSSKNWETLKKRFQRIPDFIQSFKNARKLPNEKGYVYLQEFIPNDGFDIKIVVIGNKLSFIVRNAREGDFRASGGGDLHYEKSLVTKDIIQSAFDTSNKLGFQCMGYDYVINSATREAKIVEISYGFSHTALMNANGYWDRNGVWYDEPLDVPTEVIKELINIKTRTSI